MFASPRRSNPPFHPHARNTHKSSRRKLHFSSRRLRYSTNKLQLPSVKHIRSTRYAVEPIFQSRLPSHLTHPVLPRLALVHPLVYRIRPKTAFPKDMAAETPEGRCSPPRVVGRSSSPIHPAAAMASSARKGAGSKYHIDANMALQNVGSVPSIGA